jgi:type IV pilus assembly protein PilP
MRIAPPIRSTSLALAAALAACSSAPTPSPMGSAEAARTPTPAAPAGAADRPALPPGVDDAAVAAGARGRDPFHAAPPPVIPPPDDVRHRKSRHFTVDQLKLVGIVTRTAEPRAMLLDPRGKGWIVGTGDIVGRPEVVAHGAVEQTASWRVDRIRSDEVVLVRDDVDTAGVSIATRVLALRDPPPAIDDD